ncbi:uncharacterized protein G2W53_033080 [Senna tora]|uniref:Uncharacterized protein n=1 Tax=Senna tora TaxID=362788 RepID=A0A834WCF7_9FABA|nr:uncharacterized protein G2W53_033080 [Senna tora]
MYVDAKTISNLEFDPGGATNIFLLATGKLSHLVEIFTTLNMPSLCFWKCCYVELEEYIGNFIVYSEDASKVFDEMAEADFLDWVCDVLTVVVVIDPSGVVWSELGRPCTI